MSEIAMKYAEPVWITTGHTYAVTVCQCGDVLRVSGSVDEVRAAQAEWHLAHVHCTLPMSTTSKVFWLSFCDGSRPTGQQFLGACLVSVTAEDAGLSAVDVALSFPFAQPGAEWLAAAIRKAHELGCNPGGEVASAEVSADNPNLSRYPMGVLLDRDTIERLDAEVES